MRPRRLISVLMLGSIMASCGGTAAVSSSSGGAAASVAVKASSPAASAAKPSAPASSAAPASAAASAKPSAAVSASAPATASGGALTGTPIKLGILDDVTGVGAIEGALMRIDADLVIDQINSTGGINGHPVEAVYADPKGQADQALQLGTSLAQQDKVDVLLGGIFSPECLGLEKLAPKVGLVYMPLNGCANEQFTATSCDKNSFRVFPVGKQLTDPSLQYEIKTFGKKWGILYPDYALGQSTRDNYDASLKKFGANLDLKIAVPLNEANMTPYVSKIPTDGSITALVVSETGSDLARAMSLLQQFGIPKKMAIITQLGKESFAGVYPEAMNGAVITGGHTSEPDPSNKFDVAYDAAFKAMAKGKDASVAGPLGGPDKAVAGVTNGYNVFVSMNALKVAMRASNFTGKADTAKLITALEDLNAPQGPDFPTGPVLMSKTDHQGRFNLFTMKINGQKEDIIQTYPADSLPPIGTCKVAG